MNTAKDFIKVKKNAITLAVLLISILTFSFSFISFLHVQNDIENYIMEKEKSIHSFVKVLEKSSTDNYKDRIKRFAKIKPGILQAFEKRERNKLLKLSMPYLKSFKKENKYFSTFTWVTPENEIFLRLHNPNKFGDEVYSFRNDVKDSNLKKIQVAGYMSSHKGLQYRIVQPLKYKNKHIGLVQFGLNTNFIVEVIEKELNIPIIKVIPNNKAKIINDLKKGNYIQGDKYTIHSNNLEFIKPIYSKIDWSLRNQQINKNGNKFIICKILSLNNYKGESEGWFFGLIDISDLMSSFKSDIIKIVLIGLLVVILFSIFMSRSFSKLVDRIIVLNNDLSLKNLELEEKVLDRTKELQHQEEKLFVTLRSIGDGVLTTDLYGKIVLINKVTENLTGWTQKEAVGLPVEKVFNIINENTGKTCENPVTKVLTTKEIILLANHTVLISKSGTHISIEDSGAPIFDKNSNIIGTVLVFRDVTEHKKTQEELLRIKKLESVGVLAGGIAHDFNNILTAILGNIDLATIHSDKNGKAHRLLIEAKKASIRAKDLTLQLLTFSKGGGPVKKTASIGKVIMDSADFVLHGSTVACEYNIPDNLCKADVDTGQISQVIQNLVINAKHAMPEGGKIKITCKNIDNIKNEEIFTLPTDKTYIKIIIEDTGSGIPKKHLDKIFDPYFSTKQTGSGLGLAISYSILSKHDGKIFVESEVCKGTIFTIYLPSIDSILRDTKSSEKIIPENKNRYKILIMDDDKNVNTITKGMLELLDHEVFQSVDGKEAIKIYNEQNRSENPIDLLIMDLTIPGGMGGKEAVQEILKLNPIAKVIVVSGYSNDPVISNYQEYGFKDALVKPFSIQDLDKVIKKLMD